MRDIACKVSFWNGICNPTKFINNWRVQIAGMHQSEIMEEVKMLQKIIVQEIYYFALSLLLGVSI